MQPMNFSSEVLAFRMISGDEWEEKQCWNCCAKTGVANSNTTAIAKTFFYKQVRLLLLVRVEPGFYSIEKASDATSETV